MTADVIERKPPVHYDAPRVFVERFEIVGNRIIADVRLMPDPQTSITFRGVRVFPGDRGHVLVSVGVRREDGTRTAAVVWPKPWTAAITAAILERARFERPIR